MGMNPAMLRKMQERIQKMQEELGNETVEGSAGGGAVTIVVNGHQQVQSVKIDPDVIDPEDVSMLEDLILAAANDGLQKAQELTAKRMSALTGGLRIPGLM